MIRWLALALGLLGAVASPVRSDADPCTVLFATELGIRDPAKLEEMRAELGESAPETLSRSALAEKATYWVTTTTGPAWWFNCSSGTKKKSLFFPIGLVLRPIAEIGIGAEKLTIFQTEYGLRVVIDTSAIAPVTAEDAYVFAAGDAVYKVCKPTDSICEIGGQRPWDGTKSENWPYINGQFAYLHNTEPAAVEAARAEWAAFRMLQANADSGLEDPFGGEPYPARFSDEPACAVREAKLYALKMRPDPEAPNGGSEYFSPVKYRLCFKDPNGTIRTSRIKFVTHDIAEEMFARLWSATSPGHLRGRVERAIRVAYNYADPFLTRIECGEETQGAGRTYGWLGLPDAPDAGPVTTDLSSVIEASETIRRKAFHFRPYLTHMGLSERSFVLQGPIFQDIELEVGCTDDLRPARPIALRIHYRPLFPDAPLKLDLVKLDGDFDTLLGSYGRNSDRIRKQRLSDGMLFRICDFNEYIIWRAVLRAALMDVPQTQEAAEALGVAPATMAEHFTHLIMASVFTTGAKLRSKSNYGATCS